MISGGGCALFPARHYRNQIVPTPQSLRRGLGPSIPHQSVAKSRRARRSGAKEASSMSSIFPSFEGWNRGQCTIGFQPVSRTIGFQPVSRTIGFQPVSRSTGFQPAPRSGLVSAFQGAMRCPLGLGALLINKHATPPVPTGWKPMLPYRLEACATLAGRAPYRYEPDLPTSRPLANSMKIIWTDADMPALKT